MRLTPGMTVTLGTTVYGTDGLPVDAPDLTFRFKVGCDGEETTVTPIRNSLGNYSATFVVPESGNLHYRWDTDGALDVAKEGVVNVAWSAFT